MKPSKVLVVDDSKLMHRIYDSVLDNIELLHAYDGREALEILATHIDTDLVVLDINMPRMNGLEFLSEAKLDPLFAVIPVLIVSTEGSEQDTVRGLEAGAAGYLRKPFESEELLGMIEKLAPAVR